MPSLLAPSRPASSAPPRAYPHVVSLQLPRFGHLCTGSIVSDRHVLTLARCFDDGPFARGTFSKLTEWLVVAGVTHVNASTADRQTYGVTRVTVPRQYAEYEGLIGDIALVQTNAPFRFTDAVQPICLPLTGQTFYDNGECFLAGFENLSTRERTSTARVKSELRLRQVREMFVPYSRCYVKFTDVMGDFDYINAPTNTISHHLSAGYYIDPVIHLCYGEGAQSTCAVDTRGDPVSCKVDNRYVLAGVATFGHDFCAYTENLPSVFNSVAYYARWIRNVINRMAIRGY